MLHVAGHTWGMFADEHDELLSVQPAPCLQSQSSQERTCSLLMLPLTLASLPLPPNRRPRLAACCGWTPRMPGLRRRGQAPARWLPSHRCQTCLETHTMGPLLVAHRQAAPPPCSACDAHWAHWLTCHHIAVAAARLFSSCRPRRWHCPLERGLTRFCTLYPLHERLDPNLARCCAGSPEPSGNHGRRSVPPHQLLYALQSDAALWLPETDQIR